MWLCLMYFIFFFFFFWYVVTIVALEGAATHPRTRFAQKDNNGYAVLLHRLSVRMALFPDFSLRAIVLTGRVLGFISFGYLLLYVR